MTEEIRMRFGDYNGRSLLEIKYTTKGNKVFLLELTQLYSFPSNPSSYRRFEAITKNAYYELACFLYQLFDSRFDKIIVGDNKNIKTATDVADILEECGFALDGTLFSNPLINYNRREIWNITLNISRDDIKKRIKHFVILKSLAHLKKEKIYYGFWRSSFNNVILDDGYIFGYIVRNLSGNFELVSESGKLYLLEKRFRAKKQISLNSDESITTEEVKSFLDNIYQKGKLVALFSSEEKKINWQ